MAKRLVMKRPKFVSPWTYDRSKNVNSVTGGTSLTVPNQSMSVREIMIRFTRGTPPLTREAIYNEEYETPDMDSMDLAEREAYAAENAQRIKDLQKLAEEARQQKNQPPKPASAASGPRSDSSDSDDDTKKDE